MSKLIPMEEAAEILGMSLEQLTELRSNNEIFGYRDGSNWKFKMSELERVAGELDIKLNLSDAAKVADDLSESFGFDLSDSSELIIEDDSSVELAQDESGHMVEDLDSAEYIEDSSVELFQQPLSEELSAESASINIDDDDSIDLADSGLLKSGTSKELSEDSPLKLEDSGDLLASSDESIFDDEEELSFGSSSLRLASESSKSLGSDKGSDSNLLDDEPEKGESASDTGKMLGANAGAEDDLLLSDNDDLFSDELSLADSASFEDSAELSSDFEDSDLVLDDSDSSSEIMLESNRSGINLSANESGIALADEPLELGGSDIDALELPEDDEMIVLEDSADPEAATMMQEDDFNLTPLEASMDEDDSSGSQVIALEDSEIYADDSAATILGGSEEFASEPGLLDDPMSPDTGLMPYSDAPADEPMMMPAGAVAGGPAVVPEAPYSLWQVLSLGLVASLLTAGGMVAYNLAQNLWYPQDQVIGSSVLNFFLNLTGMN